MVGLHTFSGFGCRLLTSVTLAPILSAPCLESLNLNGCPKVQSLNLPQTTMRKVVVDGCDALEVVVTAVPVEASGPSRIRWVVS